MTQARRLPPRRLCPDTQRTQRQLCAYLVTVGVDVVPLQAAMRLPNVAQQIAYVALNGRNGMSDLEAMQADIQLLMQFMPIMPMVRAFYTQNDTEMQRQQRVEKYDRAAEALEAIAKAMDKQTRLAALAAYNAVVAEMRGRVTGRQLRQAVGSR